uniref:ATP synthase F1F0 subunit B n=1 Tax=Cyanidiococcus yangmingshanensis TaxID=2690220 RepID=A0A7H0WBF2_9RHOD|nr:ATP synthase F1F0 subunit B [Cyanidiococcus yangmingshanensis]UNJ18954.1 Ymf39 [Cyanidioschyzonaceae sp. 2 FvB-2021]
MVKYLFLLSVFLTVNRFFILNEESLVLLCFTIFVFIGIIKINVYISIYLDNKIEDLRKNLEVSISSVRSQILSLNGTWNYLNNSVYLINKFKKYSNLQLLNVEKQFVIFLMYKIKNILFDQLSRFERVEIETYTLMKVLLQIQLDDIIKQFLNIDNIANSFINHEKIILI